MTTARLTGMGHAFPATMYQDELWERFFSRHYAELPAAGRLFGSVGVRTRHGVVNPCHEDVSGWGTGARMDRFLAEAMPLGKDAVAAALDDAGIAPDQIGLFAVASCTGYVSPGLDIRLAADLGMGTDVQRLSVGHMGCYAAVPGLGAVADYAVARNRPAVLLCLELPSLHVQPATSKLDQIVAHAIFGDAAAAVVVEPGVGPGYAVVDVLARTDTATADHMTWDITDLGFRMGLSPRVPAVLARHVLDVVTELVTRNGLALSDVDGWAVHPGGPRILDVVTRELGLGGEDLAVSRDVLRDHGNCSSGTALIVLDQLARRHRPGTVVMLAFGPGLTLYTGLLVAS
ncbi:MAG TPA: 3-oxoacyl-[acyl-carrier-protein] synthase III C-terminal domain-containing protein [Mycobacteriales bacterium]|nr:3-oxoacyl-[acyl-carrier-protein] synthase III C-terminal domain-containing protein [Mycobacteriales bacterium]